MSCLKWGYAKCALSVATPTDTNTRHEMATRTKSRPGMDKHFRMLHTGSVWLWLDSRSEALCLRNVGRYHRKCLMSKGRNSWRRRGKGLPRHTVSQRGIVRCTRDRHSKTRNTFTRFWSAHTSVWPYRGPWQQACNHTEMYHHIYNCVCNDGSS